MAQADEEAAASAATKKAEWLTIVAELCERLGLEEEPPHLCEALTHPSYTNEAPGSARDNQRLEFLGDAVLALCVSEVLMAAFADVGEGALTVMRASLVNTTSLAAGARLMQLDRALRLGRGADAAGERHRTGVLADAMEAVLGAVYLDHGLDKAREVTRRVLEEPIAKLVADGGIERDAKSRLQELVQARGLATPSYQVIAVDGPPHARLFTVEASVALESTGPEAEVRKVTGHGQGRSKKLAEQAAATAVLEALDQGG
jgi:ribonuclease-3